MFVPFFSNVGELTHRSRGTVTPKFWSSALDCFITFFSLSWSQERFNMMFIDICLSLSSIFFNLLDLWKWQLGILFSTIHKASPEKLFARPEATEMLRYEVSVSGAC